MSRCSWCGKTMPQDGYSPPLLRVCPECAHNGRLSLQPDPPARPGPLPHDPDAIPPSPRWIRYTALVLLALILWGWLQYLGWI